jgi:hypothetical protein
MGGVGINSNISEILNVYVVAFESIMELCMAGDEDDSMYSEG